MSDKQPSNDLVPSTSQGPRSVFLKQLIDNYKLLTRSLACDELLTNLMCVNNDFIARKFKKIKGQDITAHQATELLLNMLRQMPPDQEEEIIGAIILALRQHGQEHVANIFRPESDVHPMSEEHYELLQNMRKQICDYIDPLSDGLLDELISRNVFSDSDRQQVVRRAGHELLKEFMDILCRKSDDAFDLFIKSLCSVGKEHVASLLGYVTELTPMSETHRRLLTDNLKELCKFLDPLSAATDAVFNLREMETILSIKTGYHDMSLKLITILMSKSDAAFHTFIKMLCSTNQEHVTSLLGYPTEVFPMTETHRNLLIKHRNELCKFLDPICVAVDDIFNLRELDIIKSKKGECAMSFELITILIRKSDASFDKFIEALYATDQQHVVYILTGDGEPPLSSRRQNILRMVRKKLITYVDSETSLLVWELFACQVLNTNDVQHIEAQLSGTRKNVILLNAIQRKSNLSYDKFLTALENTGQEHIALALKGLEIHGYIDTNFLVTTTTDQLNTIIQVVRRNIEALVSGTATSIQMIATLMAENGFEVSDVRLGSIMISFRCYTAASLGNLRRLYTDKTLDRLFTEQFCPEFAEQGLESLTLRISDDEFERCNSVFLQTALMTDTHRQILLQTAELLSDRIRISEELLNNLSMCEVRKKAVLQCETETKQVRKLFHIVSHQSDAAFTRLVTALRHTRQFDVADTIENYESSLSLSGDRDIETEDETFDDESNDAEIPLNISPADPGSSVTCRFHCDRLPTELLEFVLMRTFIKQFIDDYKSNYKTHEAIQLAHSSLAGVCSNWWQTMNGWPQSPTRHWLRHKLCFAVKRFCRPYTICPRMKSSLLLPSAVSGVTQYDDKLFILCSFSGTIHVFGPDNSHLTEFEVKGVDDTTDIVACTETGQLYVAGWSVGCHCVWQVSLDGSKIVQWWPSKSKTMSNTSPLTLSMMPGSRRLLVTSQTDNTLLLFGPDGVELKRVSLPDMEQLQHASETIHGTFIVSDYGPPSQVVEVDVNGHVINTFTNPQQLDRPVHLSLDSDGRVFVADCYKRRVLLLNSRLQLERILLDAETHQLHRNPSKLCYSETTGQLIIGSGWWGESGCIQQFKVSNS